VTGWSIRKQKNHSRFRFRNSPCTCNASGPLSTCFPGKACNFIPWSYRSNNPNGPSLSEWFSNFLYWTNSTWCLFPQTKVYPYAKFYSLQAL